MTSLVAWWKEHLLACPSKHFLHVDCPGCGLQRSIIALLEGDLANPELAEEIEGKVRMAMKKQQEE